METPDEEKKYYRETISTVGSLEHDIGCSGVYSLETIEKVRFVRSLLTVKYQMKNSLPKV